MGKFIGSLGGGIFGVALLIWLWNLIMWFSNPERDAIRAARTEAKIEFTTWGLRLALFAGFALVILPLLIVIFVGLWKIWQRLDENNRQRDGSHKLREYHLLAWWARMLFSFQNGGLKPPKILVDLDYTIGSAVVVGGTVGYREVEPAAGWDLAKLEATERNRVSSMQAISPGDRALIEGETHIKTGVPNAATAKLLEGRYAPEPPALPAPTSKLHITATPAIHAAKLDELPLGTNALGDVVAWLMAVSVHLRVTGQTQKAGKTNLIQTIAAGALHHGHQVIVLDRRQFKDWQAFDGRAELIDSRDPANVVAVLERLGDIYQQRDRELAAGYNGQHRRIVAVIGEFGSTAKAAKADGVYGRIELPLDLLMREAGGVGVHVVFEDQITEKTGMSIIGNATPVAGYLPPGYGQAGGDYGAHKLNPYQFAYDGQVLDTWHIAPELPGILANVTTLNGDRIIDPASVRPAFGGDRTGPATEQRPNAGRTAATTGERTPNAPNRGDTFAGDKAQAEPPFAVRDAPKKELILWWIDNIGGTQADFREWSESRGRDLSRGYISDVFNGKV